MSKFVFLSEKNRARYLNIISPAGNFFVRTGIHPNVLTYTGLVLSILAGIVYSTGSFFWGAWVLVLAGTCDALDGQIARQTGKSSTFGAFLDSSLDRFNDMFPFMGLAYYFAGGQSFFSLPGGRDSGELCPWTVVLIIIAITGAFMVSYTRARAEGLGLECKRGLMQRPERITLLVIGSLLGSMPWVGSLLLKCAIFLLALSTNLTALFRIHHVRKQIIAGGKSE